jgi:hypothetical protein
MAPMRMWRWFWTRRSEVGFLLLIALLAYVLGRLTGTASENASSVGDVASAWISGLAALVAVMAMGIAVRTFLEQQQARHADAAERSTRRLEVIAELVLQIVEAASSGSWDRWRFARRRLRVALAAIGRGVVLQEATALAEIEHGYENEGVGSSLRSWRSTRSLRGSPT